MTNEQINILIKKLESIISSVVNKQIEITVRGLTEFTFSFEGQDNNVFENLKKYFGAKMTGAKNHYDAECDYTCIYCNLSLN